MQFYWIKNNRYYKVLLQKTLFNTIDIICVWGRIGGNLGNFNIIPCQNDEDIEFTINNIKKRRLYKKYIEVK